MNKKISAVVFEGSQADSNVEEMMVSIRHAALLDNLQKMKQVSKLGHIYLHTNRPELATEANKMGAEVSLNTDAPSSFHFGRELQKTIAQNNIDKAFCLNGASCPLVTVQELEMICSKLQESVNTVLTNNIQSADLVAFTVPPNIEKAQLPATDNSLAMVLRDSLGMHMELLPQTLGLLFDIDTPTDILVLGAGPYAGNYTRKAIDDCKLDYKKINEAKNILNDEYRDIALIGRVGAPVIERLNSVLKLRLRVFSEERGMKALGRIDENKVISLLGLLIDRIDPEQFFSYLSQVADCAFIDSRVLMYHYKFKICDKDRFLSDLGLWESVEQPWLRSFTRAAENCSIPVILGGHSLVSGSLWALSCELSSAKSSR